MLIPGQIVTVKVIGQTLSHYRSLGYDVNLFDIIQAPIEHLTDGSKVKVDVECDICKKQYSKPYKQYLKQHTYNIDTCNKCRHVKIKQTCMQQYGVENVFQVDEYKNKQKETCVQKYGVENISMSKDIKNKKKNTFIKKYGVDNPAKVKEVQEKTKKTNIARYGVPVVTQNPDVIQKIKATNLKKYGYESVMQNANVKAKAIGTLANNGDIPTSKQQLEIYEIIKNKYSDVKLNHPFSSCSLDILLVVNNINIDIEYDGWFWHQNQQADIKRDKFLQNHGFKVLRIRSGHMLPDKNQLFDAIDYLVTTNHHFKEIILPDWKQPNKINEMQEVSV